MNKFERSGGEAVVQYLDSNLRVIKPGAFVRCAVTGQPIPLDELKYWSVERQGLQPVTTEKDLVRIAGMGAEPWPELTGLPVRLYLEDEAGLRDFILGRIRESRRSA